MNRAYKTVWNNATQTMVAVSEFAKSRGKASGRTGAVKTGTGFKLAKISVALLLALGTTQTAFSLEYGVGATANPADSTAIGDEAEAQSIMTTAIGKGAIAGPLVIKNNKPKVRPNREATAVGHKAKALKVTATAVGKNALADGESNIALGANAQATGRGQSIAIGGGKSFPNGDIKESGARSLGDQAIAIGANTIARGDSSIVIGGDDLDAVASTLVAEGVKLKYGVANGTPLPSGATVTNEIFNNSDIGQKYKNFTGKFLVDNTDMATRYKGTEAKQASVAIGVSSTAMGEISTAVGTKSFADGFGSTAFGVGARATMDNSVALGAGSETVASRPANRETTATVISNSGESITYGNFFAGADYLSPGDQVSVGAVGFERQIKNLAPGEISLTSTDAVNGSQLYVITAALQNSTETHFHVNEDDPNQKVGDTKKNFGSSRSIAGATGAKAVTAGMQSRATGANAVAMGQDSKALNDNTIAIGNNATAGAISAADLTAYTQEITAAQQAVTAEKAKQTTLETAVTTAETDLKALIDKAASNTVPADQKPTIAELNAAKKKIKDAQIAVSEQKKVVAHKEALVKKAEANKELATANAGDEAPNAIAIGNNSKATASSGIALGSESLADRKALTGVTATHTGLTGNKVYAMESATAADKTAIANTVKGDLGAVSVGTADKTRQITNVAAGRDDSDAVNVAQLKSVSNVVDKGFKVSANNRDTIPNLDDSRIKLGNGVLKIIGAGKRPADAPTPNGLTADLSKVAVEGKYSAKNVQTVMFPAGDGSAQVQIQIAEKPKFEEVKVGNSIVINKDGNNKITGLVEGTDDTDSVNVSQLKKALTNITVENQVNLSSNSPFVYTKDIAGVPTQLVRVDGKFYSSSDIGTDGKPKPTATVVTSDGVYTSALGQDGTINGKERVTNIKSHITSPNGNYTPPAPNSSELNDAATLTDVLNAGWNLNHNDTTKVDFVKAFDTVNFKDTDTVAFEMDSDNKVSNIKANVKTTELTANTDGTVKPKVDADKKQLVNAEQVVNAINQAGWNVTSDVVGSGEQKGTKETKLVQAGNTVTLKAGDNLAIEQKDKEFTYSLKKDIKVSSIKVGDTANPVTIDNNGINAGDKIIAGVKDGVAPTDAVNVKQLKSVKEDVTSTDKTVAITKTQNTDGANIFDLSVNIDNDTIKKDKDGKLYADIKIPETGQHTVKGINSNEHVEALDGEIKMSAGKTMTIEAGKNLNAKMVTDKDGKTATLQISTARRIDVDRVTTNQLVVNNGTNELGEPTFIDMGYNQVHNVKAGTAPTDAVNVSQLNTQLGKSGHFIKNNGKVVEKSDSKINPEDTVNFANGSGTTAIVTPTTTSTGKEVYEVKYDVAVDNKTIKVNKDGQLYAPRTPSVTPQQLQDVSDSADAGIAASMAHANLLQPFESGQSMITAGVGYHKGEAALAVGVSAISDNGHWILRGSGSINSQAEASLGAGIGYVWE